MRALLDIPKCSKSNEAIEDRILRDTTSPIDAANGVAKLSGFILNLCDSRITATSTKSVINRAWYYGLNDYYQQFKCVLTQNKTW